MRFFGGIVKIEAVKWVERDSVTYSDPYQRDKACQIHRNGKVFYKQAT